MEEKEVIKILKSGGIGVMLTDTIYGVVGIALNPKTVERMYRVRKRHPKKPFIILVSSQNDLKRFGIFPSKRTEQILKKLWPGPVSIVLNCQEKKFTYLHRGTNTLAIRFPKDKQLQSILKKTGPLLAPSTNLEGKPPAKTIEEAKAYFGSKIDFYWDKGKQEGTPSVLIQILR